MGLGKAYLRKIYLTQELKFEWKRGAFRKGGKGAQIEIKQYADYADLFRQRV